MYNYKIKYKIFALFILICFTIHTVTTTFAKYVKDVDVGTVNLKITGKRYWEGIEAAGFADGAFKEIINTEKTLILESMGKSGAAERIRIPITGLSAGVYQLSFKVVMTGSNVRVVDNTKYVYGCTIDGNDSLQRNVGYLWKSVTPAVEEDVKLTFVVTEAEAQAGTVQTWLWNFANIGDNSTFRLHLKDIKIEKSAVATSPYIDFLNTKFLYLDEVTNATVEETRGMESFVTTASYEELKVRVETLSGCEHFYVPIKGLTSGKTYTISFDELTTNMSLANLSAYDYGAWVDTSYSYTGKNNLWLNKAHRSQSDFPHTCIKSIGSWHTNNTFTFTAKAATMYWVWEYAAFSDNNWGHIHLKNVSIKEGTATKLMMNKNPNSNSNTTENVIENKVINAVNNSVENKIINANITNNVINNIIGNDVTDNINNNTNVVKNETDLNVNANTVNKNETGLNVNANTVNKNETDANETTDTVDKKNETNFNVIENTINDKNNSNTTTNTFVENAEENTSFQDL